MVYIIYMKGKLMKDSTECSDPPSDSEMAVSMVTNSLKRPAEEMMEPQDDQDSNPMKLLNNSFLDRTKKFKKDELDAALYFNNNGMDSDGGSVKPSDPESEADQDDKSDVVRESEHEVPTPAPFPCVWMNGASPMRSGDDRDSSPQPPTLLPITPQEMHDSQKTPPPLASTASVTTTVPAMMTSVNTETPLSLTATPNALNPLVVADMNVKSPSEHGVSDGETSLGGASPIHAGSHIGSPLRNGASPLPANTTMIDSDGQSVEVCPQCQKVFKRKVYLQRHMEREHWSTAKVFKCQDCNYETKHQSNLSVHRRTHTGERPYHCGCCGQRYTQGHLLKSHIRSRHGGNMELYNLEKKSDSTRGRKSLDMKHDLLSASFPGQSPAGTGAGTAGAQHHHHKQDKISSLLAAAAATSGTPQTSAKFPYNSASMLPSPMSQYMSSLGPYFNNLRSPNAAAAAAAAMMNPMLGGGLLTSPRFFPGMSGMPMSSEGMMPPSIAPPMLPILTSMDTSTTTTTATSLSSQEYSSIPGLKLPVKMPETVSPSKLSPNKPQSASLVAPSSPFPSPRDAEMDSSMPQDLSIKREPTTITAAAHPPSPRVHVITPTVASDAPEDLRSSRPSPHRPYLAHSPKKADQSMFPSYETPEEQDENRAPRPSLPTSATPSALFSAAACLTAKNCSHEAQLKKLRKNVLRMLSVLTPDIGIENDIDFETDQVDQLLYEVIYSNLD